MIADWPALKTFALGLNLPEVTLAHPWGHEALKAHGKMWCWWSPFIEAAVFRASHEEREMLLQADPDTFTLHPHYAPHNLILVRAGRIDDGWARARLTHQWRDAAPKRWLKAWDAANPALLRAHSLPQVSRGEGPQGPWGAAPPNTP